MTGEVHAGGCLCGAVRFEARGTPSDTGYCHCRMCQRSSGGPAQVWAIFAPEAFAYVAGSPAVYRSSDHGTREFCAACGSQLLFRDADGVSVNVPCLDAPERLPPARHIWTESRIAWFEVADDLPRHALDRP